MEEGLISTSHNQENGGNLPQIWQARLFPFPYGARLDPFAVGGDSRRHTETGTWGTGMADVGKEFGVAVGRFDEELGLFLGFCAGFELLQTLGALFAINGQVAVEGETLAVETAAHDGQQDGRWAYEGHHLQSLALRYGHEVGAGVGHSRTTGLADDAHRFALTQGSKILGELGGIGMLAHRIEGQVVDIDVAIHLFEKTAGRTDFFYDEMANATNDFRVV